MRTRPYHRQLAAKKRQDRIGAAIIAASVALGAGFFGLCVKLDHERGITVSESLASVGIGSTTAETARVRAKLSGRPVVLAESAVSPRFVGYCDGKLLVAAEEDAFPAPCAWIERADSVQLPDGRRVTVY